MKIAILSDIHDNIPRLRQALSRCADAEELICCGDLCSPFIAKELALGFTKPIHIVFGNNDGDRFRLAANALKHPHLNFHGEYVELRLGERRFSVNHFDNIGRGIAEGGTFDVVCFGHNHQVEVTRQNDTLILNPGEIYGGLTGQSTFLLYDTDTHTAEKVTLD